MQLELYFNIGYVCKIPEGFVMEQDLTPFAIKILCDDPTACDEVDNIFATEAGAMIDILYECDMDED